MLRNFSSSGSGGSAHHVPGIRLTKSVDLMGLGHHWGLGRAFSHGEKSCSALERLQAIDGGVAIPEVVPRV